MEHTRIFDIKCKFIYILRTKCIALAQTQFPIPVCRSATYPVCQSTSPPVNHLTGLPVHHLTGLPLDKPNITQTTPKPTQTLLQTTPLPKDHPNITQGSPKDQCPFLTKTCLKCALYSIYTMYIYCFCRFFEFLQAKTPP